MLLHSATSNTPPPVVFVVDDDAAMRAYVRSRIEEMGCQVAEAEDGQAALAQIQAAPEVALVVADLYMPGLDGLALKAALHADARWATLPVLLVTGQRLRARDGPVLRKPFNARQLQRAVSALLSP
ncbi:MAG: response regulator [Bacteroidota bacterium]